MLNIIAICLLVSASICLVLVISITMYILYVIKHRSTNVGFAINIAQNILKRRLLIPLIILLRVHLPFPIMLIVTILRRKLTKKSSPQTKIEKEQEKKQNIENSN
ncbi:unnamed protein product [Adineta steineri]|uniref:Uncharacterized protein n=1 Tax=Adineta steineri TaxID=433720 RepID=A0A815L0U4_9BILA|nr:unnamed protein product [Adineta steineri]CAF3715922.1 unnamed protein product [Adineta steineri]